MDTLTVKAGLAPLVHYGLSNTLVVVTKGAVLKHLDG
jgi:hypothetical protein